MKRIDNKSVDMSDDEFNYYLELIKTFSTQSINATTYFENLFEVDLDGFITLIKPQKSVPWAIIHFVQQLQINQRLRFIDEFRKSIKSGEVKK